MRQGNDRRAWLFLGPVAAVAYDIGDVAAGDAHVAQQIIAHALQLAPGTGGRIDAERRSRPWPIQVPAAMKAAAMARLRSRWASITSASIELSEYSGWDLVSFPGRGVKS